MPRAPVRERPAQRAEREGRRFGNPASTDPIHQLLLEERLANLTDAADADDDPTESLDADAWRRVSEPRRITTAAWPLERLHRQYEQLPAAHQRAVFQAFQRSLDLLGTDETFDQDLWGPPPDPEDALEISFRNAISRAESEAEFAAQCISVEEAARQLGWELQEVHRALEANELVGFEHDGRTLVPVWQFVPDGHLLEGVNRVWSSFPGSAMWLSMWMTSRHPDLQGATPRDLLREGEVDRVVSLVRAMHG